MRDESNIMTVLQEDMTEAPEENGMSYAVFSSVGDRENQQDSSFVSVNEDTLFGIVCDGMGGMNGGEKASALGVQIFAESFYQEKWENIPAALTGLAKKADDAIFNLTENGKPMGAGSTAVGAVMRGGQLFWISVGDSRLYLYRKGQLLCPVKPHNYGTLLNEMLEEGKIGEEKWMEGQKKAEALISFLGIGGLERMEYNGNPFVLESDDLILLCSDGLYKSLPEICIREILGANLTLQQKAQKLISDACMRGRGRQDNTSAVIIRYRK